MKQRLFLCLTSGFDHFDTALYGFLAPTLAPLFFQTADPFVALILSYSVFGAGIVFRPLGVFIAYVTSKHLGMPRALSLSLMVIAASMFVMAMLPTFETLGLWAPLMLVGARGALDLSASWERSLSKLYLLDHAPPAGRLWWSSVYEGFSLAGLFLAALAAYSVQTGCLHWRTLFGMGSAAAFACALTRFYGLQSPTHTITQAPRRTLNLLWHHRTIITKVALAHAFSYGTYSAAFILPAALLPILGTLSWNASFYSLSCLYGIDFLAVLGLGWWLRSVSPGPLLRFASGALAITFIPLFAGLATGGMVYGLCVRLWIVLWGALFAIALTPWERGLTREAHATRALILGAGKILGTSLIGRNLVAIALACYGLTGRLGVAALPFALLGGLFFWHLAHQNAPNKHLKKTMLLKNI